MERCGRRCCWWAPWGVGWDLEAAMRSMPCTRWKREEEAAAPPVREEAEEEPLFSGGRFSEVEEAIESVVEETDPPRASRFDTRLFT